MASFSIVFGAMADPLIRQLSKAGLRPRNPEALSHLQSDADAVARLAIRGVLSDSEVDRARRRLVKKIGEQTK